MKKKQVIHRIPMRDFIEAVRSWERLMNSNHQREVGFTTFLGKTSYRADEGLMMILNEQAYQKIEMLRSPYAAALLKAFAIRTGWQGYDK